MARRDITNPRLTGGDPLAFARAITENEELLTKLSKVHFQILILDKRYTRDLRRPELIVYKYATSSFTNPDQACQSILSRVGQLLLPDKVAVGTFSTGSFGVYSCGRVALVVVHQHTDEELVSNHTQYLVERFKEKQGLDKWYDKVKVSGLDNVKAKLDDFFTKHRDSIFLKST